jgi:hypothetical protein
VATSLGDNWLLYIEYSAISTTQEVVIDSNINYPLMVIAADIDMDGLDDLLSSSSDLGGPAWYKSYGNGSFSSRTVIDFGVDLHLFAVGDINNDKLTDIFMGDLASGGLAYRLGTGGGTFSSAVNVGLMSGQIGSMQLADINGNGYLDLFYATSTDAGIYLNQNGASFLSTNPFDAPTAMSWPSLTVVDIDSDGDLDVLLTETQTDLMYLFTNFGNATHFEFTKTNFSLPGQLISAAVGDINADGLLDIFVVGHTPQLNTFLGNCR